MLVDAKFYLLVKLMKIMKIEKVLKVKEVGAEEEEEKETNLNIEFINIIYTINEYIKMFI